MSNDAEIGEALRWLSTLSRVSLLPRAESHPDERTFGAYISGYCAERSLPLCAGAMASVEVARPQQGTTRILPQQDKGIGYDLFFRSPRDAARFRLAAGQDPSFLYMIDPSPPPLSLSEPRKY